MMNMFVSNDFACGTAIYQEQVSTRKAHRALRHTENKDHKAGDRARGKKKEMSRKDRRRAETQDGNGRLQFLWGEDYKGNFVPRRVDRGFQSRRFLPVDADALD